MARPRRTTTRSTGDYRHDEARRKNNPPVGMASYEAKTAEQPRAHYGYDPHLSPQLIWAGKPGLVTVEVEDAAGLEVDTVSLHIHERVSTQAIIHAVQRPQALQLDLFADPRQPLREAVEFYRHDVDWANRLLLGDSLLVMNSLLQRELLAGQVQMIYIDPPYGVKFASNFQPRIDQRGVREGGRRPDPRAGADQGLPRHLDAGHPLLPDLPARPAAGGQGAAGRQRIYLRADQR